MGISKNYKVKHYIHINKAKTKKQIKMDNFYAQTVYAKSFTKKLGDNNSSKSRCNTCDSMGSQVSFRSTQSSVPKSQLVKRLLAKEDRNASFSKEATKKRTETTNSVYSMEHVFWC